MEINRKYLQRSTIEEFSDLHGLVMTISERGEWAQPEHKYYASFDRVEIMENGMLTSMYGDGATEEEAIQAYAKRISGKNIAVGAYTGSRKNIPATILTE